MPIPAKHGIILALVVALLGAACGSSPTTRQPGTGFPREKFTLTIWSPDPIDQKGLANPAGVYQGKHQNVSFDFKQIDPNQFEQTVLEAWAAGKGPDIVVIGNDRVAKFHDKLEPMPTNFFGVDNLTALSSIYPKAVTTDTIVRGKVYALPIAMETLTLFWNKGLFQDRFNELINQGVKFNQNTLILPPPDWTHVIETTKLLTKRDGDKVTQSGIALGISKNVPFSAEILATLLLQQGVAMTSDDHLQASFHLADKQDPTFFPGASSLQFLRGFTDSKSDYYTWNADQPDALQAFINGNLGMMLSYPRVIPTIRQRNPQLNFGLAPLPQLADAKQIVDFGNYSVFGVSKASHYSDVAWDFLNTLNTTGSYPQATGRASARINLPATTTVTERFGRDDPDNLQVATAQSWYKGTDPVGADRILTQALDQVTQQQQDPKSAMVSAAQNLTQLLQSQSKPN